MKAMNIMKTVCTAITFGWIEKDALVLLLLCCRRLEELLHHHIAYVVAIARAGHLLLHLPCLEAPVGGGFVVVHGRLRLVLHASLPRLLHLHHRLLFLPGPDPDPSRLRLASRTPI